MQALPLSWDIPINRDPHERKGRKSASAHVPRPSLGLGYRADLSYPETSDDALLPVAVSNDHFPGCQPEADPPLADAGTVFGLSSAQIAFASRGGHPASLKQFLNTEAFRVGEIYFKNRYLSILSYSKI